MIGKPVDPAMPWNMPAVSTDEPSLCFCVEIAMGPVAGSPFFAETRYHTPCQGGSGATVSSKLTPPY